MVAELVVMPALASLLMARVRSAGADQRGMTTETVVITALLVILALAAVGVIAEKVMDKAENIDVDEPAGFPS
jgi:hypothetical protein